MEGPMLDERVALVALLRARPNRMTWAQIAAEVAFRGSAVRLWEEHQSNALLPDPHVTLELEAARDEISEWDAAGLRFLTVLDDDFPQQLLDIRETPPLLFILGTTVADDSGFSIVGSRRPSKRGLQIAEAAAQMLVSRGLTVVAGLAAGIDTAAHVAALDAGGRTVAVIGTGVNRSYPAQNRDLQAEIARRGLVLSQFLPDAPPSKHSFPMRNAVMSGYGRATIVVEAGETSGTRIQARLAVEHGRPVILTDSVTTTTWGAALAARPGVHVVSGADELESAIATVLSEQDELRSALRELAASYA